MTVLVTLLLSVAVSAPEYRHVNLGAAVGKVVTGSHTTAGFKEDKRNKATPGTYHTALSSTVEPI